MSRVSLSVDTSDGEDRSGDARRKKSKSGKSKSRKDDDADSGDDNDDHDNKKDETTKKKKKKKKTESNESKRKSKSSSSSSSSSRHKTEKKKRSSSSSSSSTSTSSSKTKNGKSAKSDGSEKKLGTVAREQRLIDLVLKGVDVDGENVTDTTVAVEVVDLGLLHFAPVYPTPTEEGNRCWIRTVYAHMGVHPRLSHFKAVRDTPIKGGKKASSASSSSSSSSSSTSDANGYTQRRARLGPVVVKACVGNGASELQACALYIRQSLQFKLDPEDEAEVARSAISPPGAPEASFWIEWDLWDSRRFAAVRREHHATLERARRGHTQRPMSQRDFLVTFRGDGPTGSEPGDNAPTNPLGCIHRIPRSAVRSAANADKVVEPGSLFQSELVRVSTLGGQLAYALMIELAPTGIFGNVALEHVRNCLNGRPVTETVRLGDTAASAATALSLTASATATATAATTMTGESGLASAAAANPTFSVAVTIPALVGSAYAEGAIKGYPVCELKRTTRYPGMGSIPRSRGDTKPEDWRRMHPLFIRCQYRENGLLVLPPIPNPYSTSNNANDAATVTSPEGGRSKSTMETAKASASAASITTTMTIPSADVRYFAMPTAELAARYEEVAAFSERASNAAELDKFLATGAMVGARKMALFHLQKRVALGRNIGADTYDHLLWPDFTLPEALRALAEPEPLIPGLALFPLTQGLWNAPGPDDARSSLLLLSKSKTNGEEGEGEGYSAGGDDNPYDVKMMHADEDDLSSNNNNNGSYGGGIDKAAPPPVVCATQMLRRHACGAAVLGGKGMERLRTPASWLQAQRLVQAARLLLCASVKLQEIKPPSNIFTGKQAACPVLIVDRAAERALYALSELVNMDEVDIWSGKPFIDIRKSKEGGGSVEGKASSSSSSSSAKRAGRRVAPSLFANAPHATWIAVPDTDEPAGKAVLAPAEPPVTTMQPAPPIAGWRCLCGDQAISEFFFYAAQRLFVPHSFFAGIQVERCAARHRLRKVYLEALRWFYTTEEARHVPSPPADIATAVQEYARAVVTLPLLANTTIAVTGGSSGNKKADPKSSSSAKKKSSSDDKKKKKKDEESDVTSSSSESGEESGGEDESGDDDDPSGTSDDEEEEADGSGGEDDDDEKGGNSKNKSKPRSDGHPMAEEDDRHASGNSGVDHASSSSSASLFDVFMTKPVKKDSSHEKSSGDASSHKKKKKKSSSRKKSSRSRSASASSASD